MTLISCNSLPDKTDKTKVIGYAVNHANGPKHELMEILRNLRSHGLENMGICTQLARIIGDLEEWQNRE